VAVDAVADGGSPLEGAGLEGGAQVGLDVLVDCLEGDFVEAAFGGPLLFVLDGGGDEAGEAVAAVAVAGAFDHFAGEAVVEAGDTFTTEEC
jgi:hypothetical protein